MTATKLIGRTDANANANADDDDDDENDNCLPPGSWAQ